MKTSTTRLFLIVFSLPILLFNNNLKSQSLNNTVWDFYDTNNNLLVSGGTFANDTIYFAIPALTPIATYTDSAGIFTIQDIDTTQCGITVGRYTYSISSGTADTLRFNIVSEPCQIRGAFFSPNYGIRISVGQNENQLTASSIKVYPNPSSGQFQFKIPSNLIGAQAIIRDLSGREIQNFRVSHTNQQIEIDGPKGIYLLQFNQYGNKPIIKKLIVQ